MPQKNYQIGQRYRLIKQCDGQGGNGEILLLREKNLGYMTFDIVNKEFGWNNRNNGRSWNISNQDLNEYLEPDTPPLPNNYLLADRDKELQEFKTV